MVFRRDLRRGFGKFPRLPCPWVLCSCGASRGGLEQRVAVVVLPLPLFAPGLVLWTAPVGLGGPGLCWDAGKPLCISV